MARHGRVAGIVIFAAVVCCATAARDNVCTKALPSALRTTLKNELCGVGSPGHTGPALCAAEVRKAFPQWAQASIVDLCKGAHSTDPATCAAAFARSKRGASGGAASSADVAIVLELCRPFAEKGSSSPSSSAAASSVIEVSAKQEKERVLHGPALCYAGAPSSFSKANVVKLCTGAVASVDGAKALPPPSQCASLEPLLLTSSNKRHSSSSSSSSSSSKLRAALTKQPSVLAGLCQKARGSYGGEGPLECALALPPNQLKALMTTTSSSISNSNSNPSSNDEAASTTLVGVCGEARDETPAKCFAMVTTSLPSSSSSSSSSSSFSATTTTRNNKKKGSSPSQSTSLSSSSSSTTTTKALTDHERAVDFCRQASSLAPARCFSSSALSSFDPSLRFALCARSHDHDHDANDEEGGGGGEQGVAACVKAAPNELSSSPRGSRGGSSSHNNVEELLVRLCQGAGSAAPAHCATKAPPQLTLQERVELCRSQKSTSLGSPASSQTPKSLTATSSAAGGGSGNGPAVCFKAIRTLRVSSQDPADREEALRLCSGATGEGPAKCLEASPRTLPLSHRVDLCTQALNTSPAMCAMRVAAQQNQHRAHRLFDENPSLVVGLCQGLTTLPPPPTQEPSPAEKAKVKVKAAAARQKKKKKKKLVTTKSNNKKGESDVEEEEEAEFVSSFGGPSDCALEAVRVLGPSVDPESVMVLCRGADVRAASCAAAAAAASPNINHHRNPSSTSSLPSSSTGGLVNSGSGGGGPTTTILGLVGLSVADRCFLCARARSDMPATCAARSPGAKALAANSNGGGRSASFTSPTLSPVSPSSPHSSSSSSSPSWGHDSKKRSGGGVSEGGHRLGRLCGEASSITPGTCATHIVKTLMKAQLSEEEVEGCRVASSVPSSLAIHKMWWDSGSSSSSLSSASTSQVLPGHASSQPGSTAAAAGGGGAAGKEQGGGGVSGGASSAVLDERGSGLFAGRSVHVLLSLRDQFGVPLDECIGCSRAFALLADPKRPVAVTASASIPKGVVGLGGDLEGIRTNSSLGGQATIEFHALRFSSSGHYDLKFSLSGGGSNNVASVRVKVQAHDDDLLGPLGRCGQLLYPLLQSSPFSQRSGKSSGARGGGTTTTRGHGGSSTSSWGEGLGGTGSLLHGGEEVAVVRALKAWELLPLLSSKGLDGAAHAMTSTSFLNDMGSNAAAAAGGGFGDRGERERGKEEEEDGDCSSALASVGIRFVAGWGGDVWVVYRPIVIALDMKGGALLDSQEGGSSDGNDASGVVVEGFEVPSASMDDWQRLGLDRTHDNNNNNDQSSGVNIEEVEVEKDVATGHHMRHYHRHHPRSSQPSPSPPLPCAKSLKRAYYRHSLLWHPDRWAGYPLAFQRRAMDCFELISEAHRRLTEALAKQEIEMEQQGEGEGGGGSRNERGIHLEAPPQVISL